MHEDTERNANHEKPLSPNPQGDLDDSSRVPERVEYYSSTVLTFLIVAVIGFSIGAVGMILILG